LKLYECREFFGNSFTQLASQCYSTFRHAVTPWFPCRVRRTIKRSLICCKISKATEGLLERSTYVKVLFFFTVVINSRAPVLVILLSLSLYDNKLVSHSPHSLTQDGVCTITYPRCCRVLFSSRTLANAMHPTSVIQFDHRLQHLCASLIQNLENKKKCGRNKQ